MEEELRPQSPPVKPAPVEVEPINEPTEEDEQYPALERLADSVAALIENQQTIDAIKKWIDNQAEFIPKNHEYRMHQLWLGHAFAVCVFVGIIFLACLNIIKPEIVVSLLSLLLTAWYGRKN